MFREVVCRECRRVVIVRIEPFGNFYVAVCPHCGQLACIIPKDKDDARFALYF